MRRSPFLTCFLTHRHDLAPDADPASDVFTIPALPWFLHDACYGEVDQASRTSRRQSDTGDMDMNGIIDQVVLWYGGLPGPAQMAVTAVVGAALAYLAFKIAVAFAKRLVSAIVTAIIVFLLTTVPGHMMLTNAYEQVRQQVPTSLNLDDVRQKVTDGLNARN